MTALLLIAAVVMAAIGAASVADKSGWEPGARALAIVFSFGMATVFGYLALLAGTV